MELQVGSKATRVSSGISQLDRKARIVTYVTLTHPHPHPRLEMSEPVATLLNRRNGIQSSICTVVVMPFDKGRVR